MTEDFKAEPTHPRWYHPLIRLFGGKVFQGMGIGIIVLFVIFSDDPWWGVKAIGFFGVVVLVTFVHSFITRLLFRFRGKRFPTDRSPALEFVSIMTTGCIFVGTALSVAVALGNWGHPDAIPALRLGLHDLEPLVRAHAAWGLGRISDKSVPGILEEVLKTEKDPEVFGEVRAALSSWNREKDLENGMTEFSGSAEETG
mgnify:CR=1 FL=1